MDPEGAVVGGAHGAANLPSRVIDEHERCAPDRGA
jgi:hypothetical protein